jgi:chemotaxis protein MotB
MLGRRRTNEESPAWPGLVDLYAFTLIIVVFFFVVPWPSDDASEFERMSPAEQVENLKRQREQIQRLTQDLENTAHELELSEQERKRYADELQDARDQTDRLNERIRDQQDELRRHARATEDLKESLRIAAHEKVTQLREDLQAALGDEWKDLDPVHPTLPEFEIKTFRSGPVLFERAKHDLTESYSADIKELSSALAKVLADYPDAEIEVRGTADPDPYRGRGEIRDNVDLSAMRAATVAKLLNQRDPGSVSTIGDNFMIVGLGEVGEVIEDPQEKLKVYQRYRRVRLKIRIPIMSMDG